MANKDQIEEQKEKLKRIHDVFKLLKDKEIKMVDFRFTDLPGQWQHFTIPVDKLEEEHFYEGLGFDGSSIRGWKTINESDMLVIPDASTARVDPFIKHKSLSIICDIVDPMTKNPYERDPRFIARKTMEYLKSTGVADTAFIGPEAEFFILDHVAYNINEYSSWYRIDSREGFWNTGSESEANLGHKIKIKEGYFPVPPSDSTNDLRNQMVEHLMNLGIDVEVQHHEVATAGQGEIDFKYAPLLEASDNLQMFKYVVKNTAREAGKTATFMPKPIFGDNGSGMHTHVSFWKDGKPLFAGDKYAGLSETALYFIGGLLKHAPSLLAFTNPTTNSYKRLVPGYEAPVNLVYSMRNRSASVRIPMYSNNPKAKRIEFRCPDGTANPYLAFSAVVLAGLDGIMNKIEPGEAVDKDIYHLSEEEHRKIRQAPGSLEIALDNLKSDHEFLTKDGVFTEELINTWIDYKMEKEVKEVQLRPHPYEFHLYYEV
ncbi:MAG TPA: type I glutamate--ammonia ligase [Ignavibacteria bacterium]|nr:type I glutamate--ammonia ligase [Ignavibacteria bacterium]